MTESAECIKPVATNIDYDDLYPGVHLLPVRGHPAEERCQAIVRSLQRDCRKSLCAISRETGIPTSTLHDSLKRLRRHYHLRLRLEPKEEDEAE